MPSREVGAEVYLPVTCPAVTNPALPPDGSTSHLNLHFTPPPPRHMLFQRSLSQQIFICETLDKIARLVLNSLFQNLKPSALASRITSQAHVTPPGLASFAFTHALRNQPLPVDGAANGGQTSGTWRGGSHLTNKCWGCRDGPAVKNHSLSSQSLGRSDTWHLLTSCVSPACLNTGVRWGRKTHEDC